ncbi:MAG: holo-ACP synthase [Spirochaetia bacterium]|nr:holo-ACP synthase [Treponema sp.]MCI6315637.1 holo-ACP synthase [Spirochaetia bacterium]MCI6365962.1 holo-ACP synthase [Spirochaetia bacterium]MCI6545318.1 holo-ACP synthase [Spirochaetia bacterium]MCI7435797.1 holo-ACP synthase [Spirochaetia bacterium]
MIIGIGVDISKVSRFEKWVKDEKMIPRFFNAAEINNCRSIQSACEHYAARFAAKEAFGKALGVGLAGYDMKDIYIVNDEKGRPELKVENKAKDLLESKCENPIIHVSLSHEKEYATAFVVIEAR